MPEYQLQQARDTRANWVSNNPTLAAGEIGYQTDDKAFKIGDGVTAWTSLGYSSVPTATSMPASPQVGQRVFRSDHGLQFYWDGTRWVTELQQLNLAGESGFANDELNDFFPVPFRSVFGIYMESVEFASFMSLAGTWTTNLQYFNGSAWVTISSDSISTVATWIMQTNTINTVLNASAVSLRLFSDEISGSATFFTGCILNYRFIGT